MGPGKPMVDQSAVGRAIPAVTVAVERGQLALYCKATGQDDPVYLDEGVARQSGYRSVVAPPAFAFCIYMLGNERFLDIFTELGLDVDTMLHASQEFEYGQEICAGDVVTIEGHIAEIAYKKQGKRLFVTLELEARNQFDERVSAQRITQAFPNE